MSPRRASLDRLWVSHLAVLAPPRLSSDERCSLILILIFIVSRFSIRIRTQKNKYSLKCRNSETVKNILFLRTIYTKRCAYMVSLKSPVNGAKCERKKNISLAIKHSSICSNVCKLPEAKLFKWAMELFLEKKIKGKKIIARTERNETY